jgi:hypothetical protein
MLMSFTQGTNLDSTYAFSAVKLFATSLFGKQQLQPTHEAGGGEAVPNIT